MQWAAVLHDGLWSLKFILVLGIFVCFFFVRNDFFVGYGNASRVISVIFLIYQTIMILAVAYKVNDSLVAVYNDGEVKSVGILLWILTLGVYGGTITWIVYQYIYFSYIWTNVLIITITVVFCVGYTVCLVLRTREDISILTNGFVLLYTTYLSWSALAGRPDQTSFIAGSGTTLA